MKIILSQQVAGLGAPGDVVQVKDGYARNYLIPRGYASRWTRGAESQVATLRRARDARDLATLDEAQAAKASLEAATVTVSAKAGEGGKLFGAVTPADIATAVQAAGGPQIDKRQVEVGSPIKSLGEHRVTVRLHADLHATVGITVQEA